MLVVNYTCIKEKTSVGVLYTELYYSFIPNAIPTLNYIFDVLCYLFFIIYRLNM